MSDFRKLSKSMLASPQLTLDDVESARAEGVSLIVNNRPEGESADQTPGPAIEAAARAAGMSYKAIPIGQGGFGESEVRAMCDALESANGKVLAYCRSGTRSTLLWALARSSSGEDPDEIAAAAAEAGYDVGPVRSVMDTLASRSRHEADHQLQ
ncbi:MAG TPA: TIGR01244 family sulfur transferase [Croceibacterium sp.]|jgi:uncharacterized protein (TIGR01244 family)